MLQAAFKLFWLAKLPWPWFDFPRWQSVAVICFIGLLTGLDQSQQDLPLLPYIVYSQLAIWLGFAVYLFFLNWWLRRDGRWDGQGDLFNLLAASWAVVDIIGAGSMAAGVPQIYLAPLWIYSLWVGINAIRGAIPKAGFGYSLAGVLLATLLILIVIGILGIGFGILLVIFGYIPLPPNAGG